MDLVLDEEGRIVDRTTGEVIANKETIKQLYEDKLQKDYTETHSDLHEIGICSDLVLVKYKGEKYKCVPVKPGYTFGKVFRVALKELMKSGCLSKNARAFIGTLEPFIYFPTNSIIIDEGTPEIKDLEKIIGLKRRMIFDALKELEKEEIIKRVKRNGQSVIYFNPFLYCAGAYVLETTYRLFKNSKYNPILDS